MRRRDVGLFIVSVLSVTAALTILTLRCTGGEGGEGGEVSPRPPVTVPHVVEIKCKLVSHLSSLYSLPNIKL